MVVRGLQVVGFCLRRMLCGGVIRVRIQERVPDGRHQLTEEHDGVRRLVDDRDGVLSPCRLWLLLVLVIGASAKKSLDLSENSRNLRRVIEGKSGKSCIINSPCVFALRAGLFLRLWLLFNLFRLFRFLLFIFGFWSLLCWLRIRI